MLPPILLTGAIPIQTRTSPLDAGATPHSSLAVMFWGAGRFVFPLMLLYTATVYGVFRGKARSSPDDN
jgi:cytochrome bd-type quinol oxidase subunit 2